MLKLLEELRKHNVTMEIRPDDYIDGFVVRFGKDNYHLAQCASIDDIRYSVVPIEDRLLDILGRFLSELD